MYDLSSPDLTLKAQKPAPPPRHRWGITVFAAMAAVLCTGASSPAGCAPGSAPLGNIGPSNAELAGAVIGVGAVIAVAIIVPVEISRSHHNITGCVVATPSGLELQTSDAKAYSLEGDATGIKVGDKVKIHGSKIKKTKDSTGPGVFKVEKLSRNFGACPVASTSSPTAH